MRSWIARIVQDLSEFKVAIQNPPMRIRSRADSRNDDGYIYFYGTPVYTVTCVCQY
jgi:hypothetical protein